MKPGVSSFFPAHYCEAGHPWRFYLAKVLEEPEKRESAN
jgi:hypothetical protein